ncbi:MAG: hypothetical protein HXL38_001415 [Candidatus Saccharimonas sp.]|nr:MAG: hypothetical protein HXL38_001415 [Candidatus Saccharimonas sp.]
MQNTNETEFEKELEKIKNSKIELKPIKQKQGENKMKNIKKFNWKKLIETTKTIVIYTAVIAGLAFYFGMKQGEANTKVNNDKLVEAIQNFSSQLQCCFLNFFCHISSLNLLLQIYITSK